MDPKLKNIPVVKEFLDVFQKEIRRLPPEREINFEIKLEPGARPISKPLYRWPNVEGVVRRLVTRYN